MHHLKAKQEEILRKEILASQNSTLVLSGDFTWPAPGAYYVSAIFKDYEYYMGEGLSPVKTNLNPQYWMVTILE